jgi:hypothetical protein
MEEEVSIQLDVQVCVNYLKKTTLETHLNRYDVNRLSVWGGKTKQTTTCKDCASVVWPLKKFTIITR